MFERARVLTLILLSLPGLVFYGLVLYPWDFSKNHGLGWMMLLVLYVVLIICSLCVLLCVVGLFKDSKKTPWLLVLALNLVPIIHSFLPLLIG